jgi:hypothetical protein
MKRRRVTYSCLDMLCDSRSRSPRSTLVAFISLHPDAMLADLAHLVVVQAAKLRRHCSHLVDRSVRPHVVPCGLAMCHTRRPVMPITAISKIA